MSIAKIVVCVGAVLACVPPGLLLADAAENRPEAWFHFVQGDWVLTDLSGEPVVTFEVKESGLDNALRTKAVDSNENVVLVGLLVWNKADDSLRVFSAHANGVVTTKLDMATETTLAGKNVETGDRVTYERPDDNTWRIIYGAQNATIELKRKARK